MPTYEYECDACGHKFEKFQSIKAAPIRKCPECGKSKVRRLIGTGAGLLFKGSGFYITDYRPESYNKAAKADAPATSGDAAKPATGDAPAAGAKSEAKAESKSEAKATPPAPAPAPAPAAPKKESRSSRKS
jgi:putative FmdB family regulatory protein